ncbi:MAG TPA: cell division protein ZipA C-terminal FtsZ-binding domain-containing protein [Burkholderiales bacterium]|nr:cell division protein ZipA C-terminal FtsZ-binding domain-containing protein [Burkholderiales bacterium]
MSELQIGLLAIGAAVVAGVLVYNRIQERAARRAAERAFRSDHADVLIEAPAGVPDAAEPARAAPPRPPAPQPQAEPDPTVDYIVEFTAGDPAAQATVHEQWLAIERRHARRARIAPGPDGKSWRAALQLVSRDGAIGEADLSEFRSAVETLAAQIGGKASAPEMRSAVEAARALDDFCAETDIQVVVHVQGGPFPGTKIRAAAEASGLALEPGGKFALRNDDEQLLYTLAARDGAPFSAETMKDAAPAGLSLALDVARAPDTRRTFESMARLAHQLASVLGGSIVDDNGQALDERAVGAIAQQLDVVCARLEAKGVAPGSPTALRLYS